MSLNPPVECCWAVRKGDDDWLTAPHWIVWGDESLVWRTTRDDAIAWIEQYNGSHYHKEDGGPDAVAIYHPLLVCRACGARFDDRSMVCAHCTDRKVGS